MEYISSFTYCDSIQTEMTPQALFVLIQLKYVKLIQLKKV